MKLKYWLQNIVNFLTGRSGTMDDVIKSEIAEIEKYFSDAHLIGFIQKYESLISTKENNQPFTTWGINFKNGSLDSVKFYAHILEDLTDEEILQFIPVSDDYKKYLPLKNQGNPLNPANVGTVLEIKFKLISNKPTYGFFYLLENTKDSYKAVGYPVNLPQEIIDRGVSLGVNFEYNGDQTFFKRYYYYNKPEDKLFFEKKFGIPLLGEHIEYAEGDNVSKVNTYSGVLTEFWKKDKNFIKKERQIIKYLSDKYNLTIMSYGRYENQSTRAIYFRESNSKTGDLENLLQEHSNVFSCLSR